MSISGVLLHILPPIIFLRLAKILAVTLAKGTNYTQLDAISYSVRNRFMSVDHFLPSDTRTSGYDLS